MNVLAWIMPQLSILTLRHPNSAQHYCAAIIIIINTHNTLKQNNFGSLRGCKKSSEAAASEVFRSLMWILLPTGGGSAQRIDA